jgi:hypothetical protein
MKPLMLPVSTWIAAAVLKKGQTTSSSVMRLHTGLHCSRTASLKRSQVLRV